MSDLARRRLASHIAETTANPSRSSRIEGVIIAILGIAFAVILWRLQ